MLVDNERVRHIAGELAGTEILDMAVMQGGGNNRLYRITTSRAGYALKFYLRQAGDPRDRLGAEVTALTLLNGVDAPRLIAVDRKNCCTLQEWVSGVAVGPVTRADMDAALALVGRLWQIRQEPAMPTCPPAADASLSGAALSGQVQARLLRLRAVQGEYPDLGHFLGEELTPFWEKTVVAIQIHYQQARVDFASELPAAHRLLSPSDFGFHNALRTANNRLVFLDYEYFGWDDPAKLAGDFFLHPGMQLSCAERIPFIQGLAQLIPNDTTFLWRIKTLLPLFGLCWCLIILNEFLPDGWQRRAFAARRENRDIALARQLQKAQQLLGALRDGSLVQHFSDLG